MALLPPGSLLPCGSIQDVGMLHCEEEAELLVTQSGALVPSSASLFQGWLEAQGRAFGGWQFCEEGCWWGERFSSHFPSCLAW